MQPPQPFRCNSIASARARNGDTQSRNGRWIVAGEFLPLVWASLHLKSIELHRSCRVWCIKNGWSTGAIQVLNGLPVDRNTEVGGGLELIRQTWLANKS
jgi:hypothetical protein